MHSREIGGSEEKEGKAFRSKYDKKYARQAERLK